jgi:uncharacterized protein (DUF433 family)
MLGTNNNYLEIDPNFRFGKPVIIGTRICVTDILEMLANGMTFRDIIDDFPKLDEDKIRACLKYAAHRESIWALAI